MAVRRERPIKEIVETLKGIAKTSWLNKWARWLDQLLDVYDVEDPTEVLGIPDVYDVEKLESLLLEYCSDLVEGECLKQIEKMIREKGYRRKVTEEVVESVMDYIKSVEKKPEVIYGFPWEIRSEIEKIRARPELDGVKAYEIVYSFLIREGVEPEEAKKVAGEVAKTIPKISPERRADFISSIAVMARTTRQRVLTELAKREEKAKEAIEKGISKVSERVVYTVLEDLNSQGVFPTIEELRERLIKLEYDITDLNDVLLSLKISNLVVEKDGKLAVKAYAERIPVKEEEVIPVIKPIAVESPKYYIYSVKDFVKYLSELARSGYNYYGRYEKCISWVGSYEGWFSFLFTDALIEYKEVRKYVWEVRLGAGTHYFILITNKDIYVYVCRVG